MRSPSVPGFPNCQAVTSHLEHSGEQVTRKIDHRVYVMKRINIRDLDPKEQLEAINEVHVMAKLESPHCVRYYDSFIDDGRLNIVMEYCDGGDLQQMLKKQGKTLMDEETVWPLFIRIALGLYYLHSQRILHRDIKAANVFLTSKGEVKIGDLGVARVLGTESHFARTCVGTPYYLSPELCEDKPYNEKSDVWALGCVLYELCTLKHPFDAQNQGALIWKIIQGKYPRISSAYSSPLHKLVKKLLSRDYNTRPTVRQILCSQVVQAKAIAAGLELPPELVEIAARKAAARQMAKVSRASRSSSGEEADVSGSGTKSGSGTSGTSTSTRRSRGGSGGAGGTRSGRSDAGGSGYGVGSSDVRDLAVAGRGGSGGGRPPVPSSTGGSAGLGRSGKLQSTSGNVRGGRIRRGAPARKPRTKPLPGGSAEISGIGGVGLRKPAVARSSSESKASSRSRGTHSRDTSGTAVSRVSGKTMSEEVAELPEIPDTVGTDDVDEPPETLRTHSTPARRRAGLGSSGTRSRPSVQDLLAASESLGGAPVPQRIPTHSGGDTPASAPGRVIDDAAADEIDDIMSKQFEEDMAGVARAKNTPSVRASEGASEKFDEYAFGEDGARASEGKRVERAGREAESNSLSSSKIAEDEMPARRQKRVVHVMREGNGVPEGFWDPVIPDEGDGVGHSVSISGVDVVDADDTVWQTGGGGDWEVDEGEEDDGGTGVLWTVREGGTRASDAEIARAAAEALAAEEDPEDIDAPHDGDATTQRGDADAAARLYDAPPELSELIDEAQQIEAQIRHQRGLCAGTSMSPEFLEAWVERAMDDTAADAFKSDAELDRSDPVWAEFLELDPVERYNAMKLYELQRLLRRVERQTQLLCEPSGGDV